MRLAGSRRQLAVLAVAASDAGAKRRPSTTDAKALTTAIKECSSTVHLQRLISQKGGAFNHIHTTAVISKLAKLVSAVPDGAPPPTAARPPLDAACQEALDAWQHICLAKMDALDGRAISNTLHALARLPQRADPQLLAALLRASLTLLPTFEPQHFSNTIWALAALGHRPSATWLAAFYTASLPALPSFNSQALANTAYGLAKLDLPPELRPPEEWTDAFYAQVSFAAVSAPFATTIVGMSVDG